MNDGRRGSAQLREQDAGGHAGRQRWEPFCSPTTYFPAPRMTPEMTQRWAKM